jgi:hypothetical protein
MVVPVHVRLLHWRGLFMFMLMMGIMSVPMIVRYHFMNMLVPVLLNQMQPKPIRMPAIIS